MIAIVHSIYSQSVNASALDAGLGSGRRLMNNDAERYCNYRSWILPGFYYIQNEN